MLAIRYLNGPQAGQIYLMKPGSHKIGRVATCQIQIQSAGISKEHLEIQNENGSLVLIDLNSSNGTFLNGKKVKKAILKIGDRIGIDKLMFEIVKLSERSSNAVIHSSEAMTPLYAANSNQGPSELPSPKAAGALKEKIDHFLEEVLLPGIYQLVVVFEFKQVIFAFSLIFIFLVTFLAVIPMNHITEESIRIESLRRAQTVARALANSNERAIRSGEISHYSSDLVLKDEGISQVYILSRDGSVMAPPEMNGFTVKDLAGFFQEIKGQTKEYAGILNNGKIAASSPILIYDPEIQQNMAKAYAIVVYDPGYLRYDDGRAFSLFIQILLIAVLLGGLIFFFMYRLIERPFKLLNSQIDSALSEGRDHAEISFKFPVLQQTLVTVNSLLSRVHQGASGTSSGGAHLPEVEWFNLIQLFGYPAMALSRDEKIISMNAAFENLTGLQAQSLVGQTIQYIPDQAFQKNLQALAQAAMGSTGVIHQDRLEFGGHFYSLNCQAISASGEVLYFIITLMSAEEAAGLLGGSSTGGAA